MRALYLLGKGDRGLGPAGIWGRVIEGGTIFEGRVQASRGLCGGRPAGVLMVFGLVSRSASMLLSIGLV